MGPNSQGGESFFLPVIWTHFLACEDVGGGSQQLGGKVFFMKYGGPSGRSQQSGANIFFVIYWWAFGGSLLSGGGIIIFHVIRRHFLAPVVDPVVSLSTYITLPMEVGR